MADPVPETAPEAMPEVRVEQVAGGEGIAPEGPGEAVVLPERERAALERGERVTLTAQDTELRALLAALAEAAGVNLVVGPEVEGRVTVHLQNVRAREALETVIRESGHMITEPLRAPWGPVVFYVRPVNVDSVDAATIRERFGVSAEVADFIVRARARPAWLEDDERGAPPNGADPGSAEPAGEPAGGRPPGSRRRRAGSSSWRAGRRGRATTTWRSRTTGPPHASPSTTWPGRGRGPRAGCT